MTHLKREGDGATPVGRYRLLRLLYRPDRMLRPRAALPTGVLRRQDGWCEDARDGRYNRPVRLPSRAAHESMWREDRLYDVVGVLDWNLSPRIRGRGSAIFLHLCRPGYGPTQGCIALEPRDLALLLAAAGPRPEFVVGPVTPRPRQASGGRRRFPFSSVKKKQRP